MKKYFPYILISVVILAAVFGPLGAHLAQAKETVPTPDTAATGPGDPSCFGLVPPRINLKACLAGLGNIVIEIMSKVLWFAGQIFNLALKISIEKFKTFIDMKGIETGWEICRDVANLFFIFILLYIAIATILQISGYGMKELLVKVIIIALLVNFSGLITKFIIDATNIFALSFYDAITVESGGVTKAIISSTAKDISGVFAQGLKIQTVFKDPRGLGLMIVIVQTFGGSLLILVTSFVLFAYAIMFIIRTVSLIFLYILSPLAFLAMILPKTQPYANEWWEKLFKQSIFAPVGMFMIYLIAMIINKSSESGGLLGAIEGSTGGSASASKEGLLASVFTGESAHLLFYFIILIGLMIGSLIVAQKMGAVGSATAMKWGQKMKGAAQGYAGKISRRGVGKMAEGMLDEKSWINRKTGGLAQRMATAPLIGRGFAKLSSLEEKEKKKQEKEWEKQYGSYSNAGLDAMLKGPISGRKREAIQKIKDKREADIIKKKKRGEDIEKEDKDYEKIKKELPQMEQQAEQDENEIPQIEAEIEGLSGNKSSAANQRRQQLYLWRQQAKKRIKEMEQTRKRKEDIEEKRERRSLEEKVEEASKKAGEAAEKAGAKPPPSAPKP